MSELTHALSICRFDLIPERFRQLKKWGVQSNPDGTGLQFRLISNAYRNSCDDAASRGECTWRDVLLEEVYEALAESSPERLRTELTQVAAVCISWMEDIDRRQITAIVRTTPDLLLSGAAAVEEKELVSA